MTVAELCLKKFPQENSADYNARITYANELYSRCCEDRKKHGYDPVDFATFIFGKYTRYAWKPDDLVRAEEVPGISIVTDWYVGGYAGGDKVLIRSSNNQTHAVDPESLTSVEIPPDVLRLAVAKVTSECPLCREKNND